MSTLSGAILSISKKTGANIPSDSTLIIPMEEDYADDDHCQYDYDDEHDYDRESLHNRRQEIPYKDLQRREPKKTEYGIYGSDSDDEYLDDPYNETVPDYTPSKYRKRESWPLPTIPASSSSAESSSSSRSSSGNHLSVPQFKLPTSESIYTISSLVVQSFEEVTQSQIPASPPQNPIPPPSEEKPPILSKLITPSSSPSRPPQVPNMSLGPPSPLRLNFTESAPLPRFSVALRSEPSTPRAILSSSLSQQNSQKPPWSLWKLPSSGPSSNVPFLPRRSASSSSTGYSSKTPSPEKDPGNMHSESLLRSEEVSEAHDPLLFSGSLISVSRYLEMSKATRWMRPKDAKCGINTRKQIVYLNITQKYITEHLQELDGSPHPTPIARMSTAHVGFALLRVSKDGRCRFMLEDQRRRSGGTTASDVADVMSGRSSFTSVRSFNSYSQNSSPTRSSNIKSMLAGLFQNGKMAERTGEMTESPRTSTDYGSLPRHTSLVHQANDQAASLDKRQRVYEVRSKAELAVWHTHISKAQALSNRDRPNLSSATSQSSLPLHSTLLLPLYSPLPNPSNGFLLQDMHLLSTSSPACVQSPLAQAMSASPLSSLRTLSSKDLYTPSTKSEREVHADSHQIDYDDAIQNEDVQEAAEKGQKAQGRPELWRGDSEPQLVAAGRRMTRPTGLFLGNDDEDEPGYDREAREEKVSQSSGQGSRTSLVMPTQSEFSKSSLSLPSSQEDMNKPTPRSSSILHMYLDHHGENGSHNRSLESLPIIKEYENEVLPHDVNRPDSRNMIMNRDVIEQALAQIKGCRQRVGELKNGMVVAEAMSSRGIRAIEMLEARAEVLKRSLADFKRALLAR